MSCDNASCSSERILRFSGKCDESIIKLGEKTSYGFPPRVISPYGDYIEGAVCLDCGKWQGVFPREDPEELPNV